MTAYINYLANCAAIALTLCVIVDYWLFERRK